MCQTTTGRSLCQICSDFQATGNHAFGEVTEPQQTQKNKRNEVVVGVHVEAMANQNAADPTPLCLAAWLQLPFASHQQPVLLSEKWMLCPAACQRKQKAFLPTAYLTLAACKCARTSSRELTLKVEIGMSILSRSKSSRRKCGGSDRSSS